MCKPGKSKWGWERGVPNRWFPNSLKFDEKRNRRGKSTTIAYWRFSGDFLLHCSWKIEHILTNLLYYLFCSVRIRKKDSFFGFWPPPTKGIHARTVDKSVLEISLIIKLRSREITVLAQGCEPGGDLCIFRIGVLRLG